MSEVNRTELRVIGMSRSGNHALIHWLISQLDGSFCFLNCCEGKSNPFHTARPMDAGHCFITNLPALDIARERAGAWAKKDWLLFNHEDHFLRNACSPLYEQHHDRWVGSSRRRVDVLLLRDPFNLFASRAHLAHRAVSPRVATRIWKQHAKQFVAAPTGMRHDPVLIRYERWVRDEAYRRALASHLGFQFTDAGLDQVPSCAGGSSFDGLSYHGQAARMNVLERWRTCIDDPAYRQLFDPELLRLSRQLYGEHPAARALERQPPPLRAVCHRPHRAPQARSADSSNRGSPNGDRKHRDPSAKPQTSGPRAATA